MSYFRTSFQFSSTNVINEKHELYRKDPTFRDMIHCVAIYINASTLSVLEGPDMDKIERIKFVLTEKGTPSYKAQAIPFFELV